jgi:hypothetical protein
MNWDAATIIRIIVAALLVALLVTILPSCKTVDETVQVRYIDSTRYHTVYDTTHVTIVDSVRIEVSNQADDNSETTIVFTEQGGTYSNEGGAINATNVQSVSTKEQHTERVDSTAYYAHRAEALQMKVDSLTELAQDYRGDMHSEEEPTRSGWDRFTTWWFIGSAAMILLILLWRIADYIPVLSPYKQMIKTFFSSFRLFKS